MKGVLGGEREREVRDIGETPEDIGATTLLYKIVLLYLYVSSLEFVCVLMTIFLKLWEAEVKTSVLVEPQMKKILE